MLYQISIEESIWLIHFSDNLYERVSDKSKQKYLIKYYTISKMIRYREYFKFKERAKENTQSIPIIYFSVHSKLFMCLYVYSLKILYTTYCYGSRHEILVK